MKRCYNILLLLLLATFAFANVGFLCIDKADISSSRAAKQNSYSYRSIAIPNSDIEISHIKTLNASQSHHTTQKTVSLDVVDIVGQKGSIAFFSSLINSCGYLHLKKYLSHIYPSHNFW